MNPSTDLDKVPGFAWSILALMNRGSKTAAKPRAKFPNELGFGRLSWGSKRRSRGTQLPQIVRKPRPKLPLMCRSILGELEWFAP